MADNSENLFSKSLKELKEENKGNITAKFRVFAEPSMMPSRLASARLVSAEPENISLTKLIAMIPRAVARPASKAVDKPVAIKVARPASRPASRQTAATKISLSHLNPDIMGIVRNQLSIAENSKYTLEEYKFVEGIPEEEIAKYTYNLLQNRNALYYLTKKAKIVDKKVVYYWLSSNTNPVAIELIKKALNDDKDTRINWAELCKNPSAADILLNEDYRRYLDWDAMSKNTNPKVIKFLDTTRNFQYINWENLSANESPAAIALLNKRIKTHPWNITRNQITRNSGAIGILTLYTDKVTGDGLSANTAEAVFNLLVNILKENPKDINWAALSANPSKWAFDFLQKEENKKHIRWDMVSKNTSKSAIQLLNRRVEEENKLSDDVYKSLPKNQKIDWLEVSRNPNAIELIKARIKYEAELIETNPNYYYEKISYKELATNPSIFVKVGRARHVATLAIAPAAQHTSPAPSASPVAPPPPRAASARRASSVSRASQAARVAAARVANNAKFNAELEQLRAQRKQLQNTHLAPLASLAQRASRTRQTAARTTARTLRTQTLAASRAEYRDNGRPIIRQPLRASGR